MIRLPYKVHTHNNQHNTCTLVENWQIHLMYNTLEYCIVRLLYMPVCPSSPPCIANGTASVSESASGTGDVSARKIKMSCLL